VWLTIACFIPLSLFLKPGFASITVGWFFLVCFYNTVRKGLLEEVKHKQLLLLPVIFFSLHLIWVFFAADHSALSEIFKQKIHLFLIPAGFLICFHQVDTKRQDMILVAFIVACLLCSAVCLTNAVINAIHVKSVFYYDSELRESWFLYSRLTEPVGIPPVYLSMFTNFAFAATQYNPYFFSKKLRVVLLVYLACFILALQSVIGIISMIILMLIWIWHLTALKKIMLLVVGLAVVSGVFISIQFLNSQDIAGELAIAKKTQNQRQGDLISDWQPRLIIWASATEAIAEQPAFGYGLGGGQRELEKRYARRGFTWGVEQSLNAHNQFLSTLLNFGIIGLGVLLLMLILPLAKATRSKNFLAISFITLMILFFMTESVLFRQKGVIFFTFFYCLLFFNENDRPRADARSS
jgi:O-antigen ligase